MNLNTTKVRWSQAFRIIPSKYPPIDLFEDLQLLPEELEAVIDVEALTNDLIREQVGDLNALPKSERMLGPGCTPIMAAFTHINPTGGRFNPPIFGAFYCAKKLLTAVYETIYHQEQFLKDSDTFINTPLTLPMRVYQTQIKGILHDARPASKHNAIYQKDSYEKSQALGAKLHKQQSFGIIYHSVRHHKGEAAAIFRPKNVINPCIQSQHLNYIWDGQKISQWQEIESIHPI